MIWRRAYLWLIWQDEVELAALTKKLKNDIAPKDRAGDPAVGC